jgi:hypothetical protein
MSDDDDTWDALEELWEEEKIEHVPAVGDVDDPQFKLTDEGRDAAREVLRENDDAVLMLLSIAVENVDRPNDESAVAEALVEFAGVLRDDAGVNAFRVLRRHPEKAPGIDVENIADEFVRRFDP